jgi:hypothetical protein
MTELNEFENLEVKEVSVLEKFEGEPLPENLIERIHIEDGEIIKVEKFEDGHLVETETVKEVT